MRYLLILIALAACTQAPQRAIVERPAPFPPCPTETPATLAPAPDAQLVDVLQAQGVQRYSCTAAGWSAAIPQATLWSGSIEFARHYAGPTWASVDGSLVTAERKAGATVDVSAIPWLLLDVTAHSGPTGEMTTITQIQRLTTSGGVTPSTGCTAASVGLEVDVPYVASYWFYRASGSTGHQRCGA